MEGREKWDQQAVDAFLACTTRAEGNIWAGYRTNRTDWFPEDLKDRYGRDGESKAVCS